MFLLINIQCCQCYQLFLISIHLMFLLIGGVSFRQGSHTNISIHLMFLLIMLLHIAKLLFPCYFNTSHVSINLTRQKPKLTSCGHFNTSHVSINLWLPLRPATSQANFNTSHVSINPTYRGRSRSRKVISIHLMFLLILVWANTFPNVSRFQYISCFY